MTLEAIFFEKKSKVLLSFALFLFVDFLLSLINERPYTIFLVCEKGAINIWNYGFDSDFLEVLIECLFVVFLLLFLAAKQVYKGRVLMPCYIGNPKTLK